MFEREQNRGPIGRNREGELIIGGGVAKKKLEK